MARNRRCQHTGVMPAWSSYSYVFGPLVAALAIGTFILVLIWSSKRGSSVVAAAPRPSTETDYGLLVVVSRPATYIEGEVQRRTLADAGIKATLVQTLDGPRLMVWPTDEARARSVISS
ncbi:MAG: hypothetical protein QG597_1521 [Actinomycetota bacterium]|nr:hypothetical protein [Actinomycetota bacterium]